MQCTDACTSMMEMAYSKVGRVMGTCEAHAVGACMGVCRRAAHVCLPVVTELAQWFHAPARSQPCRTKFRYTHQCRTPTWPPHPQQASPLLFHNVYRIPYLLHQLINGVLSLACLPPHPHPAPLTPSSLHSTAFAR